MTHEVSGRRSARVAGIGELGPRADATVIALPLGRIAAGIWFAVAALIAATFVAQLAHSAWGSGTIVNLFDSDQKLNFPSAMKILLLLGSTGLLAILGMTVRDRHHRVRWLGMSGVFALLTIDEMTYMHQRLSDALHDAFGTNGPIRFAWIVVYIPLVIALAVVYWPFWRKLPNPLRTQLLVAAILFGGGSGGIEVVKAELFDDNHWKLTYGLVAALSDSLEFLGLALLFTALLTTLRSVTAAVTITLDDHPSTDSRQ